MVGNEGGDDYQNNLGDHTNDVRYSGETIDSASDLDSGELENYGADIEVARYRVSHDGTCDYGDIADPSEIDGYKVSGQEDIKRRYRRKEPRF